MYAPNPPAGAAEAEVKLFSDTLTLPSEEMRQAMMAAPLGDEQAGLDPTVNELCRRVATLLGKESAMFLPSGTMGNQIAMLVHCRPGDAVLAHRDAHVFAHEAGAGAALAGALLIGLGGAAGRFDTAAIDGAMRAPSRYAAEPRLLVIEQTSHLGGGSVWPIGLIEEVAGRAHALGMAVHIDGARLMNAVVASGASAAEMARHADCVSLCFTKGLGAPFGAVLAGSEDFIDRAWRWKQRLGGAMRQVGMLAAACLYALDHNVERLGEDHRNAAALAEGIAGLPGLVVQKPETNIVLFETTASGMTAAELQSKLLRHGVSITAIDTRLGRAVTHMHVGRAGINRAIAAFRDVLTGERPA